MYFQLHKTNPSWNTIVAKQDDEIVYIQEEPADKKWVRLAESFEREQMMRVCGACKFRYSEYDKVYELRQATKTFLRTYSEFLASVLQNIAHNIPKKFIYRLCAQQVYLSYYQAGVITLQQLAEGLIKNPDELELVIDHLERFDGVLSSDVLTKQVNNLAYLQGLCPTYYENQQKCKLNVSPVTMYPCNHNVLLWVYETEDDRIKVYDKYEGKVLSLPNIYNDGQICWGTGNTRPTELAFVNSFFNLPFNKDLTLEVGDETNIADVIEGYGLDECDYREYYDDDEDSDGYTHDNASLTTYDLLKIIKKGGVNSEAIDMPEFEEMFTCSNCRGILHIQTYEDCELGLSNNNDEEDIIIFLINEKEPDVWEARLPQQGGEDVLLVINLNDLRKL